MKYEHISDILKSGKKTLSFEFFPPKTDKGRDQLYKTAEELMALSPDFFSVTYGAGGSSAKSTLEIVKKLQARFDIPVMHHFTCTKHTRVDIRNELNELMATGIHNILALRGDPPAAELHYEPGPDEPRYAFELVKLIRERAGWFSVGVAVFPEGHHQTPTRELDSMYTRIKQETGADFGICQLCFDIEMFRELYTRLCNAGVNMPVIPGILPVVNWENFVNFCNKCATKVPEILKPVYEPIAADPAAMEKAGVDFSINLCRNLLDLHVPGLHMYCLNKAEPISTVVRELGDDWRK